MAASESSPSEVVASGVEALIGRLRDEGVAAGQARADAIVAQAEQRAHEMLRQAREEAEQLSGRARAAHQELQRAGMDALRSAARDAVLELKNTLVQRFAEEVQRLVAGELRKEEVIRQMILQVAGKVRESVDGADRIEVVLPTDVVDLEQLRRRPDEHSEDVLAEFVRGRAVDMLRAGVSLSNADDARAGLRVRIGDHGVEFDLSDAAITALLLAHLQPRFRALLDGVVR